jgi:glucosamine-6-phosphate deaminase
VELKKETIEANSRFFDSIEDVPKKAITMGIKTILNCQKIILIATGIEKAEAVFKTVRGKISTDTPSSILQLHPDITLFLDEEAASKL